MAANGYDWLRAAAYGVWSSAVQDICVRDGKGLVRRTER
jgi:hypothetical protein